MNVEKSEKANREIVGNRAGDRGSVNQWGKE